MVAVIGGVLSVWPLVVAAAIIALALVWTSRITVRVDRAGVTAHFGPVAVPRVRVALDQIDDVEPVEVLSPLEWGGWGYRITPRGTGLVVRGGPGLVVRRASGRDLGITVDDPQSGADLLHALQAREGT